MGIDGRILWLIEDCYQLQNTMDLQTASNKWKMGRLY